MKYLLQQKAVLKIFGSLSSKAYSSVILLSSSLVQNKVFSLIHPEFLLCNMLLHTILLFSTNGIDLNIDFLALTKLHETQPNSDYC